MWQNSEINLELIENSFVSLSEHLEEFAARFFVDLFESQPEFKQVFSDVEEGELNHQFISLMDFFVSNLRDEELLQQRLVELSENFHLSDIEHEQLKVLKTQLLEQFKSFLGDSWTLETKLSWDMAFDEMSRYFKSVSTSSEINSDSDTVLEKATDIEEKVEDNAIPQENDMSADAQDDITILEDSFALLADQADDLVDRFYERLFEKYPEVHPLFSNVDMGDQKKKLLASLSLVVNNLRKPDVLTDALQQLGKRHQAYGAIEAHYPAVQENLLAVMQEMAGDAWTDQIHNAWSQALTQISEIMLEAYEESEVDMSNTETEHDVESLKQELDELKRHNHEMTAKFDAIDQVRAVIEFDMDGTVTSVNQNYVDLMGYSADELAGQNHRIFLVSGSDSAESEQRLWEKLNRGEFDAGQYVRVTKDGRQVWIQAYYAPIADMEGKPFKVVQYATDITEHKQQFAEFNGKMNAISKAQAVIEFNLDGTIITANDNFLNTVGYTLDEIQGKHHRMFVDPELAASQEYKDFWDKLNDGKHFDGQYRRVNKAGEEVWINASYNPILDTEGKPFKIVKYATDGTELREKQIASSRLQSAMDGAQSNFMLCNENLDITYANPAVVEMLRLRQTELRQVWPTLDVNNLIGQNIDQFHKNPGHQRALLSDPSRLPAKAEIKVGDLEFQVNATMIKGPDGEYMGNMVEWKDITEQKKAQHEIQGLIHGATQGELDWRMQEVEKYEGFMRNLGEGINTLMDSIVAPFQETMRVLQSLADGDLTQTMEGEYKGQFADMRDSMNACINNLFNMVNEIRNSSSSINTSATEIAQGNTDLSARTEQQASALEETASTVEEMTGTVKQNADNAKQANQLASSARDTAEKGGSVVNNAISAMSEINHSSKKIADIIGVIDEIAFQTNLLALNAAVEAARAGEQGRGFAVVASEVRNLAQRSAAAAKEIKTLINDSVDKVEEGSKLVDESGQTLEDIVVSVKKVSDIIAEIAAAGEEQYIGIEQINKAVSEMDQMTQQNAALVEEAASASQAMSQQSNGLNKLVSQFNVGGSLVGSDIDSTQTEERRSDDRPWNNSSPAAATPQNEAPAPQPKAAAAGGGDDEWEEF